MFAAARACLLIAALSGCRSGPTPDTDPARAATEDLLARADGLRAAGEVQAAVALLEAELEARSSASDRDRLALSRALIEACAELPDPECVLRRADVALALAPRESWLHYKRGVALEQLDRLPESLVALDTALGIEPANVKLLQWRAHVLALLRRHAEALADLDRALAREPQADAAWIPEGRAALRRALLVDQARALDALGRHGEANAVRAALDG